MAELGGLTLGFRICSSSFKGLPSRAASRYPFLDPHDRWNFNAQCSTNRSPNRSLSTKRSGKKEHHLWMKRDSVGSGQKAMDLVRIVSRLPNEKEAIYGALDKWSAWETEFPVIAAAKALNILQMRNQWLRIIQVCKYLLSKGQVLTWATYDILILALDKEQRLDEAETIWNMILHTHTRSISRRLFSRMISLYDHHHCPEKIVEVFADMEELGVKPDQDTVKRIARALEKLGQTDKQKLLLKKYHIKWKYLHFNGERVRVRNTDYCGTNDLASPKVRDDHSGTDDLASPEVRDDHCVTNDLASPEVRDDHSGTNDLASPEVRDYHSGTNDLDSSEVRDDHCGTNDLVSPEVRDDHCGRMI